MYFYGQPKRRKELFSSKEGSNQQRTNERKRKLKTTYRVKERKISVTNARQVCVRRRFFLFFLFSFSSFFLSFLFSFFLSLSFSLSVSLSLCSLSFSLFLVFFSLMSSSFHAASENSSCFTLTCLDF